MSVVYIGLPNDNDISHYKRVKYCVYAANQVTERSISPENDGYDEGWKERNGEQTKHHLHLTKKKQAKKRSTEKKQINIFSLRESDMLIR